MSFDVIQTNKNNCFVKMKKTMIWLMMVECFICTKYVVSSKATCTKKEEGICVQWEQTGEM
jgi:hypothetical protein